MAIILVLLSVFLCIGISHIPLLVLKDLRKHIEFHKQSVVSFIERNKDIHTISSDAHLNFEVFKTEVKAYDLKVIARFRKEIYFLEHNLKFVAMHWWKQEHDNELDRLKEEVKKIELKIQFYM
jgi:hypothetical protein